MIEKKEQNKETMHEANPTELNNEVNKELDIQDTEPSSDENETDKSSFAEPVVEDVQEKLNAEKEKFLRLFAEFENYKKRTIKERISLMESANKELMVVLLPILDDFERAIAELKKNEENNDQLQGVELIYNKFYSTLTQKGLSKLEVEKGCDFNAEIHEAITQINAPTEDLKGKIIDVIESGYKLGEKIIRFPKVVVGA